MTAWLVDTGPLVAYLDAGDVAHAAVAARLDGFSGRLLTTHAVVTEAMHLVGDDPDGPSALAQFLIATNAEIAGALGPADLTSAVQLMRKYADTPMDYADATLVLLAAASGILDILTLDRRGFRTYRTSRGRAFRLVLDQPRR